MKLLTVLFVVSSFACSSLPKVKHKLHRYPGTAAFTGEPTRPYETLGPVRAKIEFDTLDPEFDSKSLCQNYYNKAVNRLVRYSKKSGGDAVMGVKSVVFLMDGRSEAYDNAECYDDGSEGQVLVRGIAIKWLPTPEEVAKEKAKEKAKLESKSF